MSPLLEGIHAERTFARKRRAPKPVIEKGIKGIGVGPGAERPLRPLTYDVGIEGEKGPVQPEQLLRPPGHGGIPGEAGTEGGNVNAPRRPPGRRKPVRCNLLGEREPASERPGVSPGEPAPSLAGERRPGIPAEDITGRVAPDLDFIENKPTGKKEELTDSLYEPYVPSIKIKGAQKHTSPIAESAAMAAVEIPAILYKPKILQSLIDSGRFSDIQLEFIARAGETHEQIMPDGVHRAEICKGE